MPRRLPTTAAKVRDWVATLDREARDEYRVAELAGAYKLAEEANRWLADTRKFLADRIGDLMGHKRDVLADATFERHARREGSVKCMDEEGLWRAVLDTRIVDPDTGEVVPQAEVIVMVYGSLSKETGKQRLTGATPSKVEVIGLDPELFFDYPDRVGWTVQIHSKE